MKNKKTTQNFKHVILVAWSTFNLLCLWYS